MQEPFIIKEYNDIYFVYKPPFWNCVTGDDYLKLKKNKIFDKNIILDWIYKLKKDNVLQNMEYEFGLLNRLDYETSGIIMVAKNLSSYIKYRKNINNHITTTKIYIALVNGDNEHEFGIITSKLLYSTLNRKTSINNKDGKLSYTEYIKLNTYKYKEKIYSLLLVKIKTGRTHQIRVHFDSIGHNVFCDKKYQKNNDLLTEECNLSKRLFLHAMYYKIENDIDGYVKIPEDLDNILNKMTLIKKYISTNNAFDILYSNILTKNILKNLIN